MVKLIIENFTPQIPQGLIEGTVEEFRYFLNPEGHHGVLVLFGDALNVFESCKNSKSLNELKKKIPLAHENPERFMRILTGLGESEILYLGNEWRVPISLDTLSTL